jgi:hypothetical protein
MPVSSIRLADGQKLPFVADAELEAGGLAARQLAHLGDELHHLDRRREGGMARGRDAILADRHAAGLRDLGAHLGCGQDAAVAGLGALAQLQFDHLDLGVGGTLGELVGVEGAVGIAAAEITRAHLPDDVAATFAVIGAVAAFAGVVREAAELGPAIQRADRVGAQ